jgi:hypothetical protein
MIARRLLTPGLAALFLAALSGLPALLVVVSAGGLAGLGWCVLAVLGGIKRQVCWRIASIKIGGS